MNEIRVKRMVLGGLAMIVVWVAIEILVEHVIARMLFGYRVEELWPQIANLNDWGALNQILNIVIALVNATVLIWLYASLRPMYGVGTKTALITSAVGLFLVFSVIANVINLGLFPAKVGLAEAVFSMIEFPVAMIAGAGVYEGTRDGAQI